MMGFVSALSASIALIILIMSVQIATMLRMSVENEQTADNLHVQISPGDDYSEHLLKNINEDKSYYITQKFALTLINYKEITVFCDYGNNLSEEVAKRILTYNYLLLSKTLPDDKVIISHLIHSPAVTNTCNIEYKG